MAGIFDGLVKSRDPGIGHEIPGRVDKRPVEIIEIPALPRCQVDYIVCICHGGGLWGFGGTAFSLPGHRIVSMPSPRMAARDAPHPHPDTPEYAPLLNGIDHVLAAGRHIPAVRSQQGRERNLIQSDGQRKQFPDHGANRYVQDDLPGSRMGYPLCPPPMRTSTILRWSS